MFDTLAMEFELMILYCLIVVANTITGLQYNISIKKLKFDIEKLGSGLLKALVIGVGIILGSIPILMTPHILRDLGIELAYSQELSTITVFTIIANGIFYYCTSFIGNLKNIFKGENENGK